MDGRTSAVSHRCYKCVIFAPLYFALRNLPLTNYNYFPFSAAAFKAGKIPTGQFVQTMGKPPGGAMIPPPPNLQVPGQRMMVGPPQMGMPPGMHMPGGMPMMGGPMPPNMMMGMRPPPPNFQMMQMQMRPPQFAGMVPPPTLGQK